MYKLPQGKLGVFSFGFQLLKTLDLDPIYVMLFHAGLSKPELRRWLLAYWCFYRVETCNWILSQENFWKAMATAAASKEYKRGTERRHFRGKLAIDSVNSLRRETPEELFVYFEGQNLSYSKFTKYIMTWKGFGPWISFKVADMVERLQLCKIDFDISVLDMFDSPQEGAKRVANLYQISNQDSSSRVLEYLSNGFRRYKAPPDFSRPVNVQEIETILCKWKSYTNDHYQLGEDLEALRKDLRNPKTKIERKLKAGCRKGGIIL